MKVNALSITNLMRKVERMDKDILRLKEQLKYEQELRRNHERELYWL
jgi:hypothetical protein